MIRVNAIGDACPLPVIKTKDAIKQLNGPGEVEVLADNEIAVQNLQKMAEQMGYESTFEKQEEGKYCVHITVGQAKEEEKKEEYINHKKNKVVVVGSNCMGDGDRVLGETLLKGFLFAVTQLETLPDTMVFFNSGVNLTCEGSDSLEDLKKLEEAEVTILSCGTCLNYYNLTEKLAVGNVTNMYAIVEAMDQADVLLRP